MSNVIDLAVKMSSKQGLTAEAMRILGMVIERSVRIHAEELASDSSFDSEQCAERMKFIQRATRELHKMAKATAESV